MPERVVVIMDPAPLIYVKVFSEGSGPARHLGKKADAVAVLARSLAPVSSGRLKASIGVDRNRDEHGRFAFGYKVYAEAPYAYFVHEGTGPSPRWPNNQKVMKWRGRQGDIPYRDFVMHPGTPAQPFLQDALIAMAGG